MKMPKTKRTYCPTCRKHTEHKVFEVKKGQPSSLSYGSKVRARKRGRARGFGNLGRYSKPAVTKFKMTGKKQTKKTDLKFQCSVCKKYHLQRKGFRTKRLELV
ncbi:TPA: 50S ribosomal protein L44e [Candidatus Woesearchaeota archaeon]|nr:50S ribosomal protein L44e [archaeon GW2011_AR15]MBS3104374.1 50S ribosomal protein L44e [Candidatus Woesearchaeota archaeon]HIH41313.1 50S ribosomal protein L44e [Candidatus Woesearchaeota archaeon]